MVQCPSQKIRWCTVAGPISLEVFCRPGFNNIMSSRVATMVFTCSFLYKEERKKTRSHHELQDSSIALDIGYCETRLMRIASNYGIYFLYLCMYIYIYMV